MNISELLRLLYNVGITVPLTLETASRIQYVATGKYNKEIIAINKVAYDILRNMNEFSKSNEIKELERVFAQVKKNK